MTVTILGGENTATSHTLSKCGIGSDIYHKWDQTIHAGPKRRANEPRLSIDSVYPGQPFLKPPTFDVDELITNVSLQADVAEDELWLLQTEPALFLDRALFFKETWYDTIPGLDGWRRAIKFSDMAMNLTYHRFDRVREWHWILEECENVKRQLDRF